jgi:hypothetical protein
MTSKTKLIGGFVMIHVVLLEVFLTISLAFSLSKILISEAPQWLGKPASAAVPCEKHFNTRKRRKTHKKPTRYRRIPVSLAARPKWSELSFNHRCVAVGVRLNHQVTFLNF